MFVDPLVPKRPLWLRRVVQAFWIVIGALLAVACVFGAIYAVEALQVAS